MSLLLPIENSRHTDFKMHLIDFIYSCLETNRSRLHRVTKLIYPIEICTRTPLTIERPMIIYASVTFSLIEKLALRSMNQVATTSDFVSSPLSTFGIIMGAAVGDGASNTRFIIRFSSRPTVFWAIIVGGVLLGMCGCDC